MSILKGNWVRVKSLKKDGLVTEVLSSGDVRVAVGSLSLICHPNDLTELARKPEPEITVAEKKRRMKKGASPTAPTLSLDLHGMRVEEAISAVDSRINSAIMAGAESLRIVHGKGTGRIKDALHRYLSQLEAVKRFRLDETNAGVTWVYF